MNTTKKFIGALLLTGGLSLPAFAQSQLQVESDLMIHPSQIAGFFDIAADKIDRSAHWEWPALSFAKPYRTSWAGVQAKGPFKVRFTTANLARQEVGFELDWVDPLVEVGRFEIHDTIIRETGGVRLILHLDGACNGMQIRVPNGQWKVRGSLKWDWASTGLSVSWQDFQFAMNDGATANVDLGQCEGHQGIHEALREAIVSVSRDGEWMRDVLRDGVLDWVEGSLIDLQTELMKAREVELRPGLSLTWQPMNLVGSGEGLIRIGGELVFTKAGKATHIQRLARDYQLASVGESGFVLPKDTLARVVEFMQANGELGYRIQSNKIPAFQSLMQSRFLQFFVWPDLMKFAKNTLFYFDLQAERAPVLSNGRSTGYGVEYDVQAPLIVNQWAPAVTKYLPYVDFRSPMTGRLNARIDDGKLLLQLRPQRMSVTSGFRSEFAGFRRVTTRISNSLLGSRVADYLASESFDFVLPAWSIGEGVDLTMKSVKIEDGTLRIPLEFKNSK